MNSVSLTHGSHSGVTAVEFDPVRSAQDIERFDGCSQCIQLTAGLLSGFMSSVRLGPITISEFSADRGIELRFIEQPESISVAFLIEGERVVERGHPWKPSEVCVTPGSAIDVCALGPSHAIFIRLSLEQMPESERTSLMPITSEVFVDGSVFADVRASIDRITKGSRAGSEGTRSRLLYARSEIAQALVSALQTVATMPKSEQRREQRSLSLVRSVQAFMWENVEEPLTLERICKEMHCGVRALIYAFKDVYGVGPMTYWKVCRLNAAHRKLRASHGETAILEIAADFGFWHMGHFSSDHKHMFGMTPSQAIEGGTGAEQAFEMTS